MFVHENQKWQLFKDFRPPKDSFYVVSLYTFEATYILSESPFHAEFNNFVPIPYLKVTVSYDRIIKHV